MLNGMQVCFHLSSNIQILCGNDSLSEVSPTWKLEVRLSYLHQLMKALSFHNRRWSQVLITNVPTASTSCLCQVELAPRGTALAKLLKIEGCHASLRWTDWILGALRTHLGSTFEVGYVGITLCSCNQSLLVGGFNRFYCNNLPMYVDDTSNI